MPSDANESKAPLPPEEIAAGVASVAAETELRAMAKPFLSRAHAWASPSVVLCVLADRTAEAGWRMVPELTAGPVPHGAERSLAKLIEDSPPGTLARATIVRPAEDIPGFKVRDTLIVPWGHGEASGYLVLRGLPRPHPPNLPEAVTALAAPLWPKVVETRGGASPGGGRVERLETLVEEVHRIAERLRTELHEEVARLRADHPAAPVAPAVDPARLEALEKARGEAAAERDRALGEAERARNDATAARAEADTARAEAEEARKAAGSVRSETDAARAEAEAVRREAVSLEVRVQELEKQLAAPPAPPTAELEEARRQVAGFQERVEAAEKARSEAEAEREFAKGEAADLRARLESIEKQREEGRGKAEGGRGDVLGELDDARRQLVAAQERAAALETARAAVEGERDRATAQMNQLWSSIESLQRQMQADKDRFEGDRSSSAERLASLEKAAADAVTARAALERERDEALGAFATARERSKQAHEQERALNERWEKTSGSFREALTALRRTPFLPPTLRITVDDLEKLLDPEGAERRQAAKSQRVLFLDRDTTGLNRLADDLEEAGLEVLIAHYPEEVAFFLKTPDSRGLAAVVCDVMAFRPDQNLGEIFKLWRMDVPGLGFLPSFKADNPTEAEKAQRIPSVLTAGYLPRPLQKEAMLEAMAGLGRRPSGSPRR